MLHIIMLFFRFFSFFVYFFGFGDFSYLEINLNYSWRLPLILFLSVIQLVRYPSLERDWSQDHVPVAVRVTPQIFIIIYLSYTISQVPQPRKRLISRSCPRSRLGHTSDIHSHSYSSDRCSQVPQPRKRPISRSCPRSRLDHTSDNKETLS